MGQYISVISKSHFYKMVKDKTAVFYLDKANPDNFSIGLKSELKPGYHIHAIFDKGDIFYIDDKEFEHEGSHNMKAFVKIIKDCIKKSNLLFFLSSVITVFELRSLTLILSIGALSATFFSSS